MNDLCGILLLNYEVDPKTGEIRLTGSSRYNGHGGGGGNWPPPSDPNPNGPEYGPVFVGAIVAFVVCLFFNFPVLLSLIIAAIVGFFISRSKKNS